MIGDRIRALREERAWTQAHLAEASGISLRTIQRLETLHSCSSETLLALAAAFKVDVRTLTEGRSPKAELGRMPAPGLTVAAAVATAPTLLFITVNLLKFAAGWAAPYDLLASFGSVSPAMDRLMLSPVLMLGGPVAAAALIATQLLRLRIERSDHAIALTGIAVRRAWPALAVGLCAIAAVTILLAYAFAENVVGALR
jgi:transcriptional regulator with XRE-family HTH domain